MAYTAFLGFEQAGSGDLAAMNALFRQQPGILVFDDETGRVVDLDMRAPLAEPRSPGRPKLGVVAREVTLLPRHWEWLAAQPGGASVTLRKLIEAASRDPRLARRKRQDAAYRFATAIAGDAPGYEEAMRALYAAQQEDFNAHIEAWPPDVRAYLEKMTSGIF